MEAERRSETPEPFFDLAVRRELFLKTVSGLATGLIIALASGLLQSSIEATRSREALQSELTRMSVDKIAEVSSAMGETENAVRLFLWSHDRLQKVQSLREPAPAEELERLKRDADARYETAKEAVENFLSVLSRNRFWLGENAYEIIYDHVAALRDEFSRRGQIDLQRMEARLTRSRPTLRRILPTLREEFRLEP